MYEKLDSIKSHSLDNKLKIQVGATVNYLGYLFKKGFPIKFS